MFENFEPLNSIPVCSAGYRKRCIQLSCKKTKVCLLLQAGKTFDLNIRVLEILLEKDTALKEFCNSKDDGRNNLI